MFSKYFNTRSLASVAVAAFLAVSLSGCGEKDWTNKDTATYLDTVSADSIPVLPKIKDPKVRHSFANDIYYLSERRHDDKVYAHKAFHVLQAMSKDTDPAVRRTVVRNLWSIARDYQFDDEAAVLQTLTNDSDADIRAQALKGLQIAVHEQEPELVLKTLQDKVDDPAPEVQKQVSLQLGYLGASAGGHVAQQAIDTLHQILDRERTVKNAAAIDGATIKNWTLDSLKTVGKSSEASAKQVMGILLPLVNKDPNAFVFAGIGDIGAAQPVYRQTAFDILFKAKGSADVITRIVVSAQISDLADVHNPANMKALGETFMALKDDANKDVRDNAALNIARKLGEAGAPYAGDVFKTMKAMLATDAKNTSVFIAADIGDIGAANAAYADDAMKILDKVLSNQGLKSSARYFAADGLGRIAAQDEKRIEPVSKLLIKFVNDHDFEVRLRALSNVWGLASHHPAHARALFDMMKGIDKTVAPESRESYNFWTGEIERAAKKYEAAHPAAPAAPSVKP